MLQKIKETLLQSFSFLTITYSLISPIQASEIIDEYGFTNPVEQSMAFQMNNLKMGANKQVLTVICWMAHELRKAGDNEKALPVLLTCAERGHDISMLEIAIMYETGAGVPKSYKEAAKWLKKSSDRGFSTAQLYYGVALLSGKGVKQDIIEGKSLIKKAADQNDQTAKELIKSNYDINSIIPDGDEAANINFKTQHLN